ncbi:hypothetical protein BO94DRAFT_6122 [Aspergillus sclerotioniger CBS 115572]|uniref:Uncharacterized protein n=1 Tax=Aspergillus sclerotioniger CBS 115572 TaxID=1450535 RepID=A0A317XGZ9_9EURO|nr:hypothetical protein BO94DRAFT_6122 [Aspergillus sclerotioniger CBS 115572]PWY96320.1 hypothetical protein BO94DRAFT_6122 [Aspergillus sclerotioniger CBS 115572]
MERTSDMAGRGLFVQVPSSLVVFQVPSFPARSLPALLALLRRAPVPPAPPPTCEKANRREGRPGFTSVRYVIRSHYSSAMGPRVAYEIMSHCSVSTCGGGASIYGPHWWSSRLLLCTICIPSDHIEQNKTNLANDSEGLDTRQRAGLIKCRPTTDYPDETPCSR